MTLSRRKFIALVGGGGVVAASGAVAWDVTRTPDAALAPWAQAGAPQEARRRALSYALLAPNPHNRQPWIADLGEADTVTLYADPDRMLPHTDPYARQITIGLGCFLELMRMAAAEDGHRVELALFPEGEDPAALDGRPVARARFVKDAGAPRDPLFAHALARRSLKEPYDTARPVAPEALAALLGAASSVRAGGTVAQAEVAALRALSREAIDIELTTERTLRESVELYRIGWREVEANPDGISLGGAKIEALRLAGLFSREDAMKPDSPSAKASFGLVHAQMETAMGHVWLTTAGNSRAEQIRAGADWVRLNLAATGLGLGVQPLSQALQEYPEMAALHARIHKRLAPDGGVVQMFGRIGYGPSQGPTPRWPLETRIA